MEQKNYNWPQSSEGDETIEVKFMLHVNKVTAILYIWMEIEFVSILWKNPIWSSESYLFTFWEMSQQKEKQGFWVLHTRAYLVNYQLADSGKQVDLYSEMQGKSPTNIKRQKFCQHSGNFGLRKSFTCTLWNGVEGGGGLRKLKHISCSSFSPFPNQNLYLGVFLQMDISIHP